MRDRLLVSMLNSCGSLLIDVFWMKCLIWVMCGLFLVMIFLVFRFVIFVYMEWNFRIEMILLLKL